MAGSSPTSGTIRGALAGSADDDTDALDVVVVIGVILSGPRPSAADPQITPDTQLVGQSL
jgi:hypothetical protein